jgi:hypothetical protein
VLGEPEDLETEELTVRRSSAPEPHDSATQLRRYDDYRTPLPYVEDQRTTPLPKPISEVRELGRRRPAPAPLPTPAPAPPPPYPRTERYLHAVPQQQIPAAAPALPVWHHQDAVPPGTMRVEHPHRSTFGPPPEQHRSSETRRVRGSPAAISALQRQLRQHEESTRATPVNEALLELTRRARSRPAAWFVFGALAGALLVWFLHSDFCFSIRLWAANTLRAVKTEPVSTAPAARPAAPPPTAPAPTAIVTVPPPAATVPPQPAVAVVVPTAVATVTAAPTSPPPAPPPTTTAAPRVAQPAPQPASVDINALPKAAPPPPKRQAYYAPPRPRPAPRPAPSAPAANNDAEDVLSAGLNGGGSNAAPSPSPAAPAANAGGGSKDPFSAALSD